MNSDSRKRKASSSPNSMGARISKLFGFGAKADDANDVENSQIEAAEALERSPRIAAGADGQPSPSKTDDSVEVKPEQKLSPSKIIDDDKLEDGDKPSPSKTADSVGVEVKTSKSDEGPPALDRQDEQPSEELPLDDTPDCSPVSSPAVQKKKDEEDDDDKVDDKKDEVEEKKEKKEADEDIKVDKVVEKRQPSLRRRKKTIADFGYHFKDGKLRTIEGDGPFKFTTQKAYEELGDVIGEHVYDLMEEMGLERRYIDVGRNRRFFFTSPDYEEKERILVLIHGSGVVKAGQWARKLIINESLSRGTQLDYIKRGLDNGWGIVVLNYNEKCVGQVDRCHSPDAHGLTEWKHAFLDVPAEADVVVVAHSYGGSVISEVVKRLHRAGDERVLCVALTDSWFSEGDDVFAVNWNTRKKALYMSGGTWQMYSGDSTHEGTSSACIDSCFNILENVSVETTGRQFKELLEESERIIVEQHNERMRKKREENGDTASAKSLELEGGDGKRSEVKKRERKEEEEEEEAEEAKEKKVDVKKEKEGKKKDEDKTEEEEEEDKEKKAEVKEEKDDNKDEDEKKVDVKKDEDDKVEVAERRDVPASDAEEDSDEGVEKDATSDIEN